MNQIIVGKGKGKYPVIISETENLAEIVASSAGSSQSVVIIADATALALYPKVIAKMKTQLVKRVSKRVFVLAIPSGERTKSAKSLLDLLESIISLGVDRSSTVIAFGGGVTTDIAGCVASLLLRGVRWIAVPTTFLAMIDASIGGKTGVNSSSGKNLIGTFWPPESVIICSEFIRTQSKGEFRGGMGEALKYFAISSKPSISKLQELELQFPFHDSELSAAVIWQCAKIKAKIVTADERESGVRAFLNFGHTIGHALEFCGGYKSISHGRAVAAGMVGALWLSEKTGMAQNTKVESLREFSCALAFGKSVAIDRKAAIAALGQDKKRRSGKLMFVLLKDVGSPYLGNAPDKRALGKAVDLSIEALAS